jgi:hypothetical protein
MGYGFGATVADRLARACLAVEVSETVVHEGGKPETGLDLLDADGLAGEHLSEVDLATVEADAATAGDGDRLVMDGIVELGQAAIRSS